MFNFGFLRKYMQLAFEGLIHWLLGHLNDVLNK